VKFSGKNPKSQLMDQLFASILKTRTDRIAHLRRAVESVTYHVSAEQIAERMLREALGDRLL
jgi:anti-sigma28 factor (negative regulator of flagellin synthesis)